MKKIAAILVICALLTAVTPLTAFAHGHRRVATVNQGYTLCGIDDCHTADSHYHDGTYYYGHYFGDGHDYHRLCDVQGCTLTGAHNHDGVACFGYYAGNGNGYNGYAGGRMGCHR